MAITTSLETFTKNYHLGNGQKECPICYDFIKKGKGVKCCNGHECCEKHFIERAKAIYEEGRMACYHDNFQKCFMCRKEMEDELFSEEYLKLLKLTQRIGMCKHMNLSNNQIHETIKSLNHDDEDGIKGSCTNEEMEEIWELGGTD